MPAQSHPVFCEPSNPNIPVWRYMDFTKFVSMLAKQGIYFARIDSLGDPFEGSFPKMNADEESVALTSNHLKIGVPQADSILKNLREFAKEGRQWTFASCWYMSEHESVAMWKMYARTEEAICIRSTFSKLKACLPDDSLLGCVKYIDYNTAKIPMNNGFWPFVHKRLSFEHEREVRAILTDNNFYLSWAIKKGLTQGLTPSHEAPKPPEGGLWRNVSLRDLIENVYIAPTAPNWFKETVEQTIHKFGFKLPVVQSSLDDSPVW